MTIDETTNSVGDAVNVMAERIALHRLFDAALDARCDVVLHDQHHWNAIYALTLWAREHELAVVSATYERSGDIPRFTVYRVRLGNKSEISLHKVY